MNNILADIADVMDFLKLPSASFAYTDKAADAYAVIEPGHDAFAAYAGNFPGRDIQRARITVGVKSGYSDLKLKITAALLWQEIGILDRSYLGYDADGGYYTFCFDVEKGYGVKAYKDLMRGFEDGAGR